MTPPGPAWRSRQSCFAGHGVRVLTAEEADSCVFSSSSIVGGKTVELMDVERDGPNIFVAAVDEQLFLVALGFERNPRHSM